MRNEMEIIFDAVSENEGFARVAVAAFIAHLNPTVEEMADIKTAVSEAVTNSIIHGYENTEGCTGPMAGAARRTSREGNGISAIDKSAMEQAGAYAVHPGKVRIHCVLEKEMLHIEVADDGKGIEDVERAMEPLFTTRPELERSGMGFAFMEAFMDDLEVESTVGRGTKVHMIKKIGMSEWIS